MRPSRSSGVSPPALEADLALADADRKAESGPIGLLAIVIDSERKAALLIDATARPLAAVDGEVLPIIIYRT
jgi:hypothetical protein